MELNQKFKKKYQVSLRFSKKAVMYKSTFPSVLDQVDAVYMTHLKWPYSLYFKPEILKTEIKSHSLLLS